MKVVFGCDQQVGQWIAGELGQSGFAGYFMAAIGVFDGERRITLLDSGTEYFATAENLASLRVIEFDSSG